MQGEHGGDTITRTLAQDTVTGFPDGKDVRRRDICVFKLVAGTVVKVADIILIRDAIVKFYNRIFRLGDSHFREMSANGGVLIIRHIRTEFISTHKAASGYVAAVLINTAHFHEVTEERAVTLHHDTRNTEVADIGTQP